MKREVIVDVIVIVVVDVDVVVDVTVMAIVIVGWERERVNESDRVRE